MAAWIRGKVGAFKAGVRQGSRGLRSDQWKGAQHVRAQPNTHVLGILSTPSGADASATTR
jgi:hypothetical protein